MVDSFNLSPSAREQTEEPVAGEYRDDDVLEIEVEGGFTYWTSAKATARRFRYSSRKRRTAMSSPSTPCRGRPDRGVTEWVQRGLRVLRLKKDRIADTLADPSQLAHGPAPRWRKTSASTFAVDLPAWFATKALIRIIEGRLRPGAGALHMGGSHPQAVG